MRAIPTAGIAFSLCLSASALAAPCDGFVDVDDGNVAYCAAVTFIKNKGITLGCTDASHYCPNDYVTRLQMALFLQRMGKGGPNNTLGDYTTTIGGGDHNSVSSDYTTVGGGANNIASAFYGAVGGGNANTASGNRSTIAGGDSNTASGYGSTVAGGQTNTASGDYSTVGGGGLNIASGEFSAVGGGYANTASGVDSFAAGVRAKANHHYSFVWGGDPNIDTSTIAIGDFVVYAPGGVRLYAGAIGAGGCVLSDGTTGWVCASDRNLKENFVALDGRDILRRLSSIPVTRWNAKAVPNVQHIGPMAQDFYTAFGLGTDSRGIGTTDAQGVAFAAIQGLNQKLEEQDAVLRQLVRDKDNRIAQIESLRAELAALRSALAELRQDRSSVAVAGKLRRL